MIPLDTKPGPFDLRFRLFGTPVRVKLSFWIMQALFGYPILQLGFEYLLIWVACGFVSVLVHEFGHVIAGRVFGYPGTIILFAFGGGAIGEYLRAKRWQRIIIAAAGPLAGFTLYGLLYLSLPKVIAYAQPRLPLNVQLYVDYGLGFLLFMNLFWNMMNLPTVVPLDGGMIMKEVVTAAMPSQGVRLASLVSLLTAVAIVAHSYHKYQNPAAPYLDQLFAFLFPPAMRTFLFSPDPLFMMIMYGLLAFQSLRMLMARDAPEPTS